MMHILAFEFIFFRCCLKIWSLKATLNTSSLTDLTARWLKSCAVFWNKGLIIFQCRWLCVFTFSPVLLGRAKLENAERWVTWKSEARSVQSGLCELPHASFKSQNFPNDSTLWLVDQLPKPKCQIFKTFTFRSGQHGIHLRMCLSTPCGLITVIGCHRWEENIRLIFPQYLSRWLGEAECEATFYIQASSRFKILTLSSYDHVFWYPRWWLL